MCSVQVVTLNKQLSKRRTKSMCRKNQTISPTSPGSLVKILPNVISVVLAAAGVLLFGVVQSRADQFPPQCGQDGGSGISDANGLAVGIGQTKINLSVGQTN